MAVTQAAPGQSGRLFVLCGPSGVGKDTLLDLALPQTSARLLPSCVSRPARSNEVDGVDAHFYTRAHMQHMIDSGDLLEWAEYSGNLYGTLRAPVVDALANQERVVLRVTLAGMRSVRRAFPDTVTIFIAPPHLDILRRRLHARGTETEQSINRRLHAAAQEMTAAPEFDHVIVNDDLAYATHELIQLLAEA